MWTSALHVTGGIYEVQSKSTKKTFSSDVQINEMILVSQYITSLPGIRAVFRKIMMSTGEENSHNTQ